MISVFTSSEVDRGFIDGVMISVFTSSEVDRGFIDGVMISVLTSSEVDRGCEAPSCQTKDFNIVFVASPLSTQQ